MNGVNRVIILGTVGRDPETRYLPNGTAVTNFSVATSERWKDKNSGEQQERTEWHRITTFSRLAEIAGEYLKKGSKVYLEGKLVTRKWQDKDGKDQYTTEVHANELQLLDGKGKQQEPQSGNASPQPAQTTDGYDWDSDIPF